MLRVFNHKKPTCATVLEATYQKTQLQRQIRDTSCLFQPATGRMAIFKRSWESQGTTAHTSTTAFIQVNLLISFSIKCVSFFFFFFFYHVNISDSSSISETTHLRIQSSWYSLKPKIPVRRMWSRGSGSGLWPWAAPSQVNCACPWCSPSAKHSSFETWDPCPELHYYT